MTSSGMTGHCLCGAMTYRVDGDPIMTVVCHCDDCQRQGGGAFSVNVIADRAAVRVEGTTMTTYTTVGTDTGQERERQFCSTCGSPVLTLLAEAPQWAILKAGTLDDRSALAPALELWCDSAQSWVGEAAEGSGQHPRGLPA
ncbi:MAG: hypothetical protein JWN65_1922 [Solirubrobacterales bacterium]|jgi:hypothetical protein|nr:hypothetical protein [Solirubrobacterales bacterium]